MKARNDPLLSASPLTEQLKLKSRRRRGDLARMAQASSSASLRRNDLLPALAIANVPIDQLRPSNRKLRKLDPAHVREVASSISSLGFCDPLLIDQDNALIDGEIRLEANASRGERASRG